MKILIFFCSVLISFSELSNGWEDDQFQCKSGRWISDAFRCDGFRDCEGGEDEICSCDNFVDMFHCGEGTCISKSLRCDGIETCPNGEDEINCSENEDEYNRADITTPSEEYAEYTESTEYTEYTESTESSTEYTTELSTPIIDSPNTWECFNGVTIIKEFLCDGYKDCLDGSDEHENVCQAYGSYTATSSTIPPTESAPTTQSPLTCKPNEYECPDGSGCYELIVNRCNGPCKCRDCYDKSRCYQTTTVPVIECSPDEFECDNVCFSNSKICDHVRDCRDGSDEVNCQYELPAPTESSALAEIALNVTRIAIDESLRQYENSILKLFIEIEPNITKDFFMEFLQKEHNAAMKRFKFGEKNADEVCNSLCEQFKFDLNEIYYLLRNMTVNYDNCLYFENETIYNSFKSVIDRKRYCKNKSMLLPLSWKVNEKYEKLINIVGKLMYYAIDYRSAEQKNGESKTKKQYYHHASTANWFDARDFCLNRGMRLVAMHSVDKHQEVVKYLKSVGLDMPYFWTSGKKRGNKYYWFYQGDEVTNIGYNLDNPNDTNEEGCIKLADGDLVSTPCTDTIALMLCEY